MQIYDNRKNLSATLRDTKTIVGKLERLLGICFQLLFIFFYLAIFDVSLGCPYMHTAQIQELLHRQDLGNVCLSQLLRLYQAIIGQRHCHCDTGTLETSSEKHAVPCR